jgi:hypothetical protein
VIFEEPEPKKFVVKKPPSSSSLKTQKTSTAYSAWADYHEFNLKDTATFKITTEPLYTADEVAVSIKAGSSVDIFLVPLTRLYFIEVVCKHVNGGTPLLSRDYHQPDLIIGIASRSFPTNLKGRFTGIVGNDLRDYTIKVDQRGLERTKSESVVVNNFIKSDSVALSTYNDFLTIRENYYLATYGLIQWSFWGRVMQIENAFDYAGKLVGIVRYKNIIYYVWRKVTLERYAGEPAYSQLQTSISEWTKPIYPFEIYTSETSTRPPVGWEFQT